MMWRINGLLLVVLVVCALGVVSAQQQSRKLFVALEAEQSHESALNTEWNQLLLEQSTWSNHGRIEQIARARLGLENPVAGQVMVLEDVR